jgi:hypothetical protein
MAFKRRKLDQTALSEEELADKTLNKDNTNLQNLSDEKGSRCGLYTFDVDGSSTSSAGFPVLGFGSEPKEFEVTWYHPSHQEGRGGLCSGLPSRGQGFSWDRLVDMEMQAQRHREEQEANLKLKQSNEGKGVDKSETKTESGEEQEDSLKLRQSNGAKGVDNN